MCVSAGAERGQRAAVCHSLDHYRDHPLLFLHVQPAQSPAIPHQVGKVRKPKSVIEAGDFVPKSTCSKTWLNNHFEIKSFDYSQVKPQYVLNTVRINDLSVGLSTKNVKSLKTKILSYLYRVGLKLMIMFFLFKQSIKGLVYEMVKWENTHHNFLTSKLTS